eukprot:TRINITY_DN175_c0_g3_i2.p1 TRINITY_DN175_c0_g3~~TRINITY_DN175_c0_g3_i2.p1  ORF type:complete len:1313 (-),score=403.59 TRINITY_DN175_c0_g3_i2:66-4004(-)
MATIADSDVSGGDAELTPVPQPVVVVDGAINEKPEAVEVDGTDQADQEEDDGKKKKKKKKGKKDKKEKPKTVAYPLLFKFAGPLQLVLILVAAVCSLAHGALNPIMVIFMGDAIDKFGPDTDPDKMKSAVAKVALKMVYVGIGAGAAALLQNALFMITGEMQASTMRRRYLKSVLRQDMGWHDVNESGVLTARIASDIQKVQDAISEKVGQFLQYTSMFITGFIVGFCYDWKMSLVLTACTPALIVAGGIVGAVTGKMTARVQNAYGAAGGVAGEVISCIRTVSAFGGERAETDRYGSTLRASLRAGLVQAHAQGLGFAFMFFVMFSSYALAFWYGSVRVRSGAMTAGEVLIVFIAVLMGSASIGQAATPMGSMSAGRGAAYHIFKVIARVPEIDSESTDGVKPETIEGRIELKDIQFCYPSRPEAQILRGLSLTVEPGKTLALVGGSGCGKSTVIGLLERFYNPISGTITLDGTELNQFNIKWLRNQIGIVTQEPVLFACSIAQNIARGMHGEATMKDIKRAAKAANAHNFIKLIPSGYDTLVGERGAQLSGGQKQRIAIARALIKDPKILLLDEATSALDTESERIVQRALEKASAGRTTIVIAHRLTTIRKADTIAVIDQGVVVEIGTHESLVREHGHYFQLLSKQGLIEEDEVKEQEQEQEQEQEEEPMEELSLAPASSGALSASSGAAESGQGDDEYDDDEGAPPRRFTARWWLRALRKFSVLPPHSVFRAFWMNIPEWYWIIIAAVAAVGNGAVFPGFALVLAKMTTILLTKTGHELKQEARYYAGYFIAIAVGAFFTFYIYTAFSATSGEILTNRMRKKAFRSITRQDMGWFDKPENMTGVLTATLATDATKVQGATGQRLGTMLQILSCITAGLIIALVSCWQLALAVIACVPAMIFGVYIEVNSNTGFAEKFKKAYSKSSTIMCEAVSNIKTVVTLTLEDVMLKEYVHELAKPHRSGIKTGFLVGFGTCISEFAFCSINALSYWYGSKLITEGKADFEKMMIASMAVMFGAMALGNIASYSPDYGKAKVACKQIFALFDRHPLIDIVSDSGLKPAEVRGEIGFRKARFSYPSRRHVPVLRGFDLTVPAGKTVALVGSSGCGKSTCVALLERFYDVLGGEVTFDGTDVRQMNIGWLRGQIGLVSQEPTLFSTTIGDNIAYGKPGATQDEIEAAARAANAHDFIAALPQGYATPVGEKGAQLSGGQKQRIAIARALVRNPRVLLLDEATSALDAESERVVQDALDRASAGRTTIVIAHRLSTIRNADIIVGVEKGVVVEQGTHHELMARRGLYYRLASDQQQAAH